MKTQYKHNPDLFRRHYQAGNALPAFSGARTQAGYGLGSILGSIARKALPLLRVGYKIAKPHLKKAATSIAKDITRSVTRAASKKLTSKIGKGRVKKTKRGKTTRKLVSKRRIVKGTTSKDIFG